MRRAFRRLPVSMMIVTIMAVALNLLAPIAQGDAGAGKPPAAARKPVLDTYFGTTVRDDYQWMENWSDPETRSWVDAENAHTRDVLDHLPARSTIRDRVTELTRSISPEYF